jgi:flagellin-like protein
MIFLRKKLFYNNKALSPIFATLIILAVVTVLFIPVFIWVSGMSSQTQDSWQASGTAASERIVIEEVSLTSAPNPGSCIVYVRNIGETAVTINDVMISLANGTKTHTYQKLPSQYPTPTPTPPATPIPQLSTVNASNPSTTLVSIVKGDLIQLNIPNVACMDQTFSITAGAAYNVQVFTTRGVGDSYQVVAK